MGMANHHDMKKVMATSISEVAAKRRDTWAEAMVLCCEGWMKCVDTSAEAKRRKDWVQALCTLVVVMLHDTCCCDLSKEPVHSQVSV